MADGNAFHTDIMKDLVTDIKKKRCVKKHCDFQLCSISCWSYLKKLTFDHKYINKRARHFIQQTICVSRIMR